MREVVNTAQESHGYIVLLYAGANLELFGIYGFHTREEVHNFEESTLDGANNEWILRSYTQGIKK